MPGNWVDYNTVNYLVNTHFAFTITDFKNEVAFSKLSNAIAILRKTGVSIETLVKLGSVDTGFDNLTDTAQLIKTTVKAKYEEEDWLKISGELNNKIRENQKSALISHLLTLPALQAWSVKDADGLFEYFLIDVQMGARMDTSRIVQANAAVQLFVTRCQLNLEKGKTGAELAFSVLPDAIDKGRWEWMKQYRVWEVNRKIFLYPKNLLEPEWRDDRSPFFKELESELVQADITSRSVETAFRNYLTKLNTVANPDVCGMYHERNEHKSILHVFSCTHTAPYQFFYRT